MIPISLLIDLEPDERVVPSGTAPDWRGVEAMSDLLDAIRPRLSARSGRPALVSWFVRMDPQIELIHGAARWPADRYADGLAAWRAMGDEIGLHVHAWRDVPGTGCVQDFGDQAWIEHCVRSGVTAFEQAFGRRCQAFRFGDHWMSDATMRLLKCVGVEIDLTVEPGRRHTTAREAFTGNYPDYTPVPRRPYVPSDVDFRVPGQTAGRFHVVPVSTVPRSWLTTTTVSAERGGLLGRVRKRWQRRSSGPDQTAIEGHLDEVTTEAILGWAWVPERPADRLNVTIEVDGTPIGSAGATAFRADLALAGKGDGRLAFRFATPASLLDGRPHAVRALVADTPHVLAGPPTVTLDSAPRDAAVTVHLDADPLVFAIAVDRLLRELPVPHLVLAVRSDAAVGPARACIDRNVDHLLGHPLAPTFVFCTPRDLVSILETSDRPKCTDGDTLAEPARPRLRLQRHEEPGAGDTRASLTTMAKRRNRANHEY